MVAKYAYMVVTGEYSDYGVEAVFSTMERANDYAALGNAEGFRVEKLRVEKVEMDPDNAKHVKAGRHLWRVLMLRNGDTVKVWAQSECDRATTGDPKPQKTYFAGSEQTDSPVIDHIVWATDEIHAVKIVNEIRTRMIAEGKWPAEGEQP